MSLEQERTGGNLISFGLSNYNLDRRKRMIERIVITIGLVPALIAAVCLGFSVLAASPAAFAQQTPMAVNLPSSPDMTHPLLSGKVPAGLKLLAPDGKTLDLDSEIAAKPTILIFYRGGWCPFCNLELGSLQGIMPDLVKLGYQTLAISPDLGPNLEETSQKHSLTYSLFTDSGMAASKAFGLAYIVNPTTLQQMEGFGIDLEKRTGLTPAMLPVPAAYVVDRSGNIEFAYANPDYRVRVDAQTLLAAARQEIAPTTSH
jgi:peroxiredoxin